MFYDLSENKKFLVEKKKNGKCENRKKQTTKKSDN